MKLGTVWGMKIETWLRFLLCLVGFGLISYFAPRPEPMWFIFLKWFSWGFCCPRAADFYEKEEN